MTPSEKRADKNELQIDIDIRCLHCDYNLRGLIGTQCPECHSTIRNSVAHNWLRCSDIQWLQHIQAGLKQARMFLVVYTVIVLTLILIAATRAYQQVSPSTLQIVWCCVSLALLLALTPCLRNLTANDPACNKKTETSIFAFLISGTLIIGATSIAISKTVEGSFDLPGPVWFAIVTAAFTVTLFYFGNELNTLKDTLNDLASRSESHEVRQAKFASWMFFVYAPLLWAALATLPVAKLAGATLALNLGRFVVFMFICVFSCWSIWNWIRAIQGLKRLQSEVTTAITDNDAQRILELRANLLAMDEADA